MWKEGTVLHFNFGQGLGERSCVHVAAVEKGRIRAMDPIDWLLASDPAISWQAMGDLTDASPAAVAAEAP